MFIALKNLHLAGFWRLVLEVSEPRKDHSHVTAITEIN